MRVSGFRQQTLGDWRESISTWGGSPILVGAIPPWLPRLNLGGFTNFGRGNPPVVAPVVRLGVAKRVGTGARTLPEVDGSQVKCIPLIRS